MGATMQAEFHVDCCETVHRLTGIHSPASWRVGWHDDEGGRWAYGLNNNGFNNRKEVEAVIAAFAAEGVTPEVLNALPELRTNKERHANPGWQRIDRIAAEALPW